MALDINALKQRLNQLNRQNDRGDSLWKPTEGETTIRIVPWKDRPEDPFVQLHFHYLGNRTQLSPITHGNPDPILEFAEAIARDDYQQSKQFRPSLRTFVPVVVRGEEAKGVRFMAFGKTVYTQLLSLIADPDYGDITDIKNGTDLVVEYIPKEKSDTGFAKTNVRPRRNSSPLSDDPAEIEKFLSEQPDIYALFKEPSYGELTSFLQAYLDPDAAANSTPNVDNDDEASEPIVRSPTAQRSQEIKSTSVKDIIDEFDSVFS